VFEVIRKLRPYFFSLREIENNVSLDIKLPLSWKYEEITRPYRSIKVKTQDKNDKYNLISLLTNANQEGYDILFTCALEIVVINKEEEEKQKLFQLKVKELQELFKKESLDKLKEINLLSDYEQQNNTSEGMAPEGNGEGQEGDRSTQGSDD
jgi:hypothetical protein